VGAAWQAISGRDDIFDVDLLRRGGHAAVLSLRPRGRAEPPVVAKIRPRGGLDLERAIHEVVLPALSVETPGFLGFANAGENDVLFLEHVGLREFVPHEPAHQAAAGRWLGQCHGASTQVSSPSIVPRRDLAEDRASLGSTHSQLATILGSTALGAEAEQLVSDVLELLSTAARRWPEWAERVALAPAVLTHGAFIARNVRIRGEADTLVTVPFDWDHVAVRSPAVDLARAWGRTRGFAASASLTEYRTVCSLNGLPLEPDVVAALATLGTVIRAAACIGWLTDEIAGDNRATPLAELAVYQKTLRAVLGT
jgi:hypothetical protein